jgi:hypothetical protein
VAWIESHQAVGHHPKTIRFAELLHVNLPTAVGHLHYFWWWALDFAPNGEIPTTASVVARACEWRGNPERFVQALVSAGFVEVRGSALVIHDWLDYAGRLVDRRAANRERQRKHRHAENGVTSRVTDEAGHAENRVTSRVSHALVTGLPTGPTGDFVPLTNQPDQPNPPVAPPSDQPNGGEIDFTTRARPESKPLTDACCPDFARTGSEHWAYCPNATHVEIAG